MHDSVRSEGQGGGFCCCRVSPPVAPFRGHLPPLAFTAPFPCAGCVSQGAHARVQAPRGVSAVLCQGEGGGEGALREQRCRVQAVLLCFSPHRHHLLFPQFVDEARAAAAPPRSSAHAPPPPHHYPPPPPHGFMPWGPPPPGFHPHGPPPPGWAPPGYGGGPPPQQGPPPGWGMPPPPMPAGGAGAGAPQWLGSGAPPPSSGGSVAVASGGLPFPPPGAPLPMPFPPPGAPLPPLFAAAPTIAPGPP